MPKFNFNMKDWKSISDLPPKSKIILLILVGILLLIIFIPTSGKSNQTDLKSDDNKSNITQDNVSSYLYSNEYEAYENILETKMADALEKVEGVGKVTVMITLNSSSEQVIEKDATTDSQQSNDETQNSISKTSIYSQDADGNQTPYVKKIYTPKIEGVIVIADGGSDSVVVENITDSIHALFGVEAHKIKIMKRATS